MHDVITIGSAVKDVFLISKHFRVMKSDQFEGGYAECVPLGGKLEIEQFLESTGGGGTNAAATFANLDLETAVITRLGDDSSGKHIKSDLEERGIYTGLIKTIKKGRTGYSTLLTNPDGERTVLVFRGVSGDFGERDVPAKIPAKWLYMSSVGGDMAFVKKVLNKAKKQKIEVMYNPGSLELKHGRRAFDAIMRDLTVLNINLEEAQMLTKSKSRDINKIIKDINPKKTILLITDGPNGAYAYQEGKLLHARTTGKKGISRTGAGDAFGSAFAASLIKKKNLEEALKIATINAESVIMEHGPKNGLLKKWPSKKQLSEVKVREMR